MYKSTRDKQEIILELFKQGKQLTQICELTVSSKITVKRDLLHNGIDYNIT